MIENSELNIPDGFKITEIGLLPEDWTIESLENLAKIRSGGSAPQGDEYFNGNNPFIRVQHIELESDRITKWDLITNEAVKKYKLKLFPKETIVFPKSGASIYLEKRAMLPLDAFIVSHLCAVISDNKKALQNFLFYSLKSIRFSEDKSDGYPTLNLSEVKKVRVSLPPLPEQKKIASVLSTIQEAKEKTENVIKATKELKKSMMKHLFTYGPVPVKSPLSRGDLGVCKAEEKETHPQPLLLEGKQPKLKETEIGMIPEHWKVVRMGTVTNIKTSFPSFKEIRELDTSNKTNELILALKVSDMNTIGNEKYVTKSAISFSYDGSKIGKFLKPFSVIFPKRGGAIGTNKKRITKHYSILDPNLIGIETSEKINGEFLFSFMDKMDLKTLQDNTPIPQLNKHNVENILLSLPPLPEQKQIAEILSAIDNKIEAEETKKQALETLFKTLLSLLMTGKIRVRDLEI